MNDTRMEGLRRIKHYCLARNDSVIEGISCPELRFYDIEQR